MKAFINGLPKAELHVHLEGTLEPTMVRTLATRNKTPLPPSLSALEQNNGYAFHDLTSFLACYYPAMSVLQTSQDFFDLTYTYLLKCKEQNILHTEMFFDPQAHVSRGVGFATVVSGIREAMVKAETELKVSAALIMCFLRDMSAESAMATLMEALPYKQWIIGVGLDSDERDNPPEKFAAVFERARKEGFLLTCHCDIDQEDSIEHIRYCLEVIGVDRIDHGTNIVEDEGLVEMVRRKGLGLTCCPISNSVVTKDFKGKDMRMLMEKGVRVTVNSDDPAYFRGYVNENLVMMHEGAEMGVKEIIQLQRNALNVSWISTAKREHFVAKLEEYVRQPGSDG